MAIGDKKPVVMQSDRAVPGGIATLGTDGKLLSSQINQLTSDVQVFTHPVNGNDVTGDGSANRPYKTIAKALSVIPKNLGGNRATVYLRTGENYTENVIISGFYGGELNLSGTAGAARTVTLNGRLSVSCCDNVTIYGMILSYENSDASVPAVLIGRCGYVFCQGSAFRTNTSMAISVEYTGMVCVRDCHVKATSSGAGTVNVRGSMTTVSESTIEEESVVGLYAMYGGVIVNTGSVTNNAATKTKTYSGKIIE